MGTALLSPRGSGFVPGRGWHDSRACLALVWPLDGQGWAVPAAGAGREPAGQPHA